MDEVRVIIPLEYQTPLPRRRGFLIGKIPGDAVLDLVAAVITLLVNLVIVNESMHALNALEALASMVWAMLLVVCAVTLALRRPISEAMHQFWARGKLLLAVVALAGVIVHPDTGPMMQIVVGTLGGVVYAILLIRYGVHVEATVEPPRGRD
jgi:hypothetical protein